MNGFRLIAQQSALDFKQEGPKGSDMVVRPGLRLRVFSQWADLHTIWPKGGRSGIEHGRASGRSAPTASGRTDRLRKLRSQYQQL